MPRRVLRKGIYWAKLNPTVGVEQAGTRPILVVSIDSFNSNSKSAIAFAITSKKPKAQYPLVYELPDKLLPKPSWVKISQVRTISTQHLGSFIASISEADLEKIMSGLSRICRIVTKK